MSQDSVHKPQPFCRKRIAEAVSNRGPSAYQPNALPLGQTGSHSARERRIGLYKAIIIIIIIIIIISLRTPGYHSAHSHFRFRDPL